MKLEIWTNTLDSKLTETLMKEQSNLSMIQSFSDEFDQPVGKFPNTPATPGEFLVKGNKRTNLKQDLQTKY
jgi:hypothetical protein